MVLYLDPRSLSKLIFLIVLGFSLLGCDDETTSSDTSSATDAIADVITDTTELVTITCGDAQCASGQACIETSGCGGGTGGCVPTDGACPAGSEACGAPEPGCRVICTSADDIFYCADLNASCTDTAESCDCLDANVCELNGSAHPLCVSNGDRRVRCMSQ